MRTTNYNYIDGWRLVCGSMGKFLIYCQIPLKFRFWLYKKRWHTITSWKFQLEIRSNKKVIAKKRLTNLKWMNSSSFSFFPTTSFTIFRSGRSLSRQHAAVWVRQAAIWRHRVCPWRRHVTEASASVVSTVAQAQRARVQEKRLVKCGHARSLLYLGFSNC